MKINAAPRILIVAAVCIVSLVGVVLNEAAARAGGVEVQLPMEAVDPRALLQGHYVTIDLTQRLQPGAHCPPNAETNEWVALQQRDGAYEVLGGARSRERGQEVGPILVKGTFECQEPTDIPGAEPVPGWLRLDLGIDRFYVHQAEAERIERVLRDQSAGDPPRAFAIVAVGRDGRGRLRGLLIDGERLELNWL